MVQPAKLSAPMFSSGFVFVASRLVGSAPLGPPHEGKWLMQLMASPTELSVATSSLRADSALFLFNHSTQAMHGPLAPISVGPGAPESHFDSSMRPH